MFRELLLPKFYLGMTILKNINNEVTKKLDPNLLTSTDRNNSYEIIYAIIDKRNKPIEEILPSFSMVNLFQTINNLQSLKYK